MKKFKALCFTMILAILSLFVLASCDSCDDESAQVTLVEKSQKLVVLKTTEVEGNFTLEEALDQLDDQGKIDVEEENGMIVSIDGVANDASKSAYWMIYTSDTNMANAEWGTIDYDGNTYGSAAMGAETLKVVDGGLYIIAYQELNS